MAEGITVVNRAKTTLRAHSRALVATTRVAILPLVVGWISFNTRYTPFTQGLFNVSSAIFFLSVMAVFVFLTARKVESRRWS